MSGGVSRLDLLSSAYAHRGLWGGDVPENSLAAFRSAAEASVGCELDVRLTRDEELVVFHDPTLGRMCGVEGFVGEIEYAALKKSALPDGSTIPTLAEALAAMGGKPVLIEVKIEDAFARVADRVADFLENHDGPVAVMSFDERSVGRLRRRLPKHFVGQLIEPMSSLGGEQVVAKARRAVALGVNYLAPHVSSLEQVAAVEPDLPRVTWTVRESSDLAAAQKLGAAVIFEKISVDLAMPAKNPI